MVDKIDHEVDRKVNLDDRILQNHRAILQDLPFNGVPGLLTDAHRAAIERLVEKHGQRNLRIKIKRIVGWASAVGDPQHNLSLSQQRAQAVHQYLLAKVAEAGIDPAEFFTSGFSVRMGNINHLFVSSQRAVSPDRPRHLPSAGRFRSPIGV